MNSAATSSTGLSCASVKSTRSIVSDSQECGCGDVAAQGVLFGSEELPSAFQADSGLDNIGFGFSTSPVTGSNDERRNRAATPPKSKKPQLPTFYVPRPELPKNILKTSAMSLRMTRDYRWNLLRAAQDAGYLKGGSKKCLLEPRPLTPEEVARHKSDDDGPVTTAWICVVENKDGEEVGAIEGYDRCNGRCSCPWCAPKEATGVAQLIATDVAHHYGGGGGSRWFASVDGPASYLGTTTLPRKRSDTLLFLINWLNRAWAILKRECLDSGLYGEIEFTRALDYTYSKETGHHPHFHILFHFEKWLKGTRHLSDLDEMEAYVQGVGERPKEIRSDVVSHRVRRAFKESDGYGQYYDRDEVEIFTEDFFDTWSEAVKEAAHEPISVSVTRRRQELKSQGFHAEATALYNAYSRRKALTRQPDDPDWLWDENRPGQLRTSGQALATRPYIEMNLERYGVVRRRLPGFEDRDLQISFDAQDFRSAPSLRGVNEYMNKLGFEFGGTASTKKGKSPGSRAPFEVLHDLVNEGSLADYAVWMEYQEVFHGRPRMRWSQGRLAKARLLKKVPLEQAVTGEALETMPRRRIAPCPRWALRWMAKRRITTENGRICAALWVQRQVDDHQPLVVTWFKWLYAQDPDLSLDWYDGDWYDRLLVRNYLLDTLLEGIEANIPPPDKPGEGFIQ